MHSSEQALITDRCQRLSHRHKGGHQWVHANHLMVWSPVALMLRELQLSHRQKVEIGSGQNKTQHKCLVPPKLSLDWYGPNLAPVSYHYSPRATDIIGPNWVQQSSSDCLRIWPMSQGMRMVWEGRLLSYPVLGT